MEYLPSYNESLYLSHHGILGQKWGVRRYQNEDGSLTDEGKARQKRWKGPDTLRYRRLNRKADRGDRLRAQGKTITGEHSKASLKNTTLFIAGFAGAQAMRGRNISLRYGDTKLGNINGDVIRRGALIAETLIAAKYYKDASDIRSSYRREKNGQYWAG